MTDRDRRDRDDKTYRRKGSDRDDRTFRDRDRDEKTFRHSRESDRDEKTYRGDGEDVSRAFRKRREGDATTELFRACSRVFLFLTSFRRKVRRGVPVSPDELSARLEDAFRAVEREVRREPHLDALYEKARYPLTVLADETVLQSGWEFARQWENRLLEQKAFGTNVGGEKYFTICDELRQDDVELAAILYTGLTLGFAGKYRDRPEKLLAVRKKLYRQLAEYLADISGEKLTPEAYRVTPGPPKKLSPVVTLVRVIVLGAGILVFYWIATAVVWGNAVGGVREAAKALGVS